MKCCHICVMCIHTHISIRIHITIFTHNLFLHITYFYIYVSKLCVYILSYGVVTISRLLTIIGLFCRILSLLQGFFAKKETHDFKEPTNYSHSTQTIFRHIYSKVRQVHNYRSLLQNIVSFIGLFCKETCNCKDSYECSHHIHTTFRHMYSKVRRVHNYRSLLQNIASLIGLFCKRDV